MGIEQWYGESENKLSQIFETCNQMGGALIFIDEVRILVQPRQAPECAQPGWL